ncbi:helix-turn-helix transcriptional regulator [Mycolicibacterium pyrenivorans]|uniref:helix-turn-helix transcriptional regulator n=1 Tax=Mycolicibacterium pyrenivorans TaxID=187102 RepID=UPI0021F298B6|nr:AraC family transcriptional regulator [Mycolicibacterium pyrenivorans]MCV7153018.1 helix-turn-helix transcriptional regulator [Mycolicibacterium pyrenivorans]
MSQMARLAGRRDGVPIYSYPNELSTPPVSVIRLDRCALPASGAHIHDFPVLVVHGDAGLIDVVAAGATVDPSLLDDRVGALALFFDPAALGDGARSPWPTWRAHPLLFPFLHGHHTGLLRLEVPAARRGFWEATIAAIEGELIDRRDGYRQAALAHLTVLLIELARMTDDVVGDLLRSGEPLLAKVFEIIEQNVGRPVSLRDVARECAMTPGYLTTVVRRRTGRTVGEWIIERRMAEARALLVGTDLAVREIAGRVGIADPGYFARLFRSAHGESPRAWRARHANVRTA